MELMNEDLVEHIVSLLINPMVEVDISYFAGGILAHLISVGGPVWSLGAELHSTVQEKLVRGCAWVCVCVWVCACVGMCVWVCVYACAGVCVCVCVCVRARAYACV